MLRSRAASVRFVEVTNTASSSATTALAWSTPAGPPVRKASGAGAKPQAGPGRRSWCLCRRRGRYSRMPGLLSSLRAQTSVHIPATSQGPRWMELLRQDRLRDRHEIPPLNAVVICELAFTIARIPALRFQKYANVSFWPKADIETESKRVFLNVCFGGKSRRSGDSMRHSHMAGDISRREIPYRIRLSSLYTRTLPASTIKGRITR